jgi:hypothetical protein
MKLPTRLSAALGVAITGLIALAQETTIPHTAKQATIIIGGFVLAWLVHPAETGSLPTPAASATAGVPPFDLPPIKPAGLSAHEIDVKAAQEARDIGGSLP